jgi:hypothetical protein
MRTLRVDVRKWSRCVVWILEKATSGRYESYKPRPLTKTARFAIPTKCCLGWNKANTTAGERLEENAGN